MGMRELSEDLDMLATQLRESLSGGGAPPTSWRFDDWLARYVTERAASEASPTRCGRRHPDIQTSCQLERGHDGNHAGPVNGHVVQWPGEVAQWSEGLTLETAPEYECNNSECNWKGPRSELCHPKHAPDFVLCPQCKETVEPV